MKKLTLAIYVIALFALTACTKNAAQKKPWPVGTVVYFQDSDPYKGALQVVSYTLGDGDAWDTHYFYTVKEANTDIIYTTHVIDYQLGTHPYHKPWWTYLSTDGKLDSLPHNGKRDTFTVQKPTTIQLSTAD